MSRSRPVALLLLAGGASACGKVDIHDVDAGFSLADVSWFAAEETLFVFYDVSADQGIGENSVIEITYDTDDGRVDWTPLDQLEAVHTHVPVDCGVTSLCGSTSVHVASEPRQVKLRMRYHRDGELALNADTVFNVVGDGRAYNSRSLIVYGVFDEANQRVQWRGRHQFPTLRNHQVTALGLRRWFEITDQRYGTEELGSSRNPYGYGVTCPSAFEDAGQDPVETEERAVFNDADLPAAASEHAVVCAEATVRDATGTFTTGAIAQKNPEVRAAFPVLRSPVHEATRIPFFLEPCERTINADHEAMQRQRLGMAGVPSTCIDDWQDEGFEDALTVAFTDAVEAERTNGDDMVLVIGIHQDERGVSEVVQRALEAIVPEERHRSSPRLAGAFVFDSDAVALADTGLSSSTLWCPASIEDLDTGDIPDASAQGCAIVPDALTIDLGPFTIGALPILPSRDQYLDFIDSFSPSQAGDVTDLSVRTPEFATTSEHFDVGDYGVATFLNDEHISADADDAFSYCVTDDPWVFVFRSDLLQSEVIQEQLAEQCENGELDPTLCSVVTLGMLPIEYLPDWHALVGESSYDLGLFWDFPFLLHMDYEVIVAGSVSAFGFSVPFGLGGDGETYLGSSMWTTDEFSLEKQLTQCRRFCDQPTFDSAGVYHVTDDFRSTYRSTCYLPLYPEVGDPGFPLDP